MGTITGYTAARTQQIEDSAIVNGSVVAGKLILTRHDTTSFDAGSVVGPIGLTGLTGANGTGITSITVCTSTTRPTGAARWIGIMIYETNTKLLYTWDGVAWIYAGGVYICTSGTRPTPIKGMSIFETDTSKLLQYQSATTGWTPPWNIPWGIFAMANPIVDQLSTANWNVFEDIIGFSINPTLITGRQYKISFSMLTLMPVDSIARCVYQMLINGISKVIRTQNLNNYPNEQEHTVSFITIGNGATLIKMQWYNAQPNLLIGNSHEPGILMIEDIGPSTGPT